MQFAIILGKYKANAKELALSIVAGMILSLIILFWQVSGVLEKVLISSPKEFLESSLAFALLLLGVASAMETIKQEDT